MSFSVRIHRRQLCRSWRTDAFQQAGAIFQLVGLWGELILVRFLATAARTIVIGVCLATTSLSTTYAQETPNSPVAEQTLSPSIVQRLIRQLEADKLEQREAAERELVQLGSNVKQLLPTITPQMSSEMKIRLQRIRQKLEIAAIEGLTQPSRISLKGTLTLAQVIEKIQEQTGNTIEYRGTEQARQLELEIDWQDLTFWQAVGALLSQSNSQIIPYSTTYNRLVIGPSQMVSEVDPFANGPFQFAVASIASERTFGSVLDGYTRLSLLFSWEPRMNPIYLQIPMGSLTATTDAGTVFKASSPQAKPEYQLNLGGCSAQLEVQMERIDRQHANIASLTGQFDLAFSSERHKFEFDRLGAGKKQMQQHGDLSVTCEGAQRNGKVYEVRLYVQFSDARGALESFRGWILANRAIVQDAQNRILENVGFQTFGATDSGVGVSYLFQLDEDIETYKLIYESPTSIRLQTIEFELTDISLP